MQTSPVFWIDNLSKIIGQQYKQTAQTDVTSAPYIHRNTTVIGMRTLDVNLRRMKIGTCNTLSE